MQTKASTFMRLCINGQALFLPVQFLHAAAQVGAFLRPVLPAVLVVINLLQHFSVVFFLHW